MKLIHHTALSVLISGILYMIFKSWGLAIASFVSGVFIDFDHVIDYVLIHGIRFRTSEFFDYFHEEKHQKVFLIFHSWEFFVILCIAVKLTDWNPWMTGFLIGYVIHMIFDIIFNAPRLMGLSFLVRYRKRFDAEVIYPKDRKEKL
jgi:hypothetical protein